MTDRSLSIASLLIALAALGVSLYSAEQAQRSATAGERMLPIAEEQVRPRLVLDNVVADLEDDAAQISLTVTNRGNAPAQIERLVLEISTPNGRRLEDRSFLETGKPILHVNANGDSSLRLPRRLHFPASDETVDLQDLRPQDFAFTLAYAIYGKPQIHFAESVSFQKLGWTHRGIPYIPVVQPVSGPDWGRK